MEKKTPSRTEKLRPVTIYLDDLEQIIELLKTLSTKVYIETKEYKYESLEELIKNSNNTIYRLELACGEHEYLPDIRLSFTPYMLELYIPFDKPTPRGIFEKVKEILVIVQGFFCKSSHMFPCKIN